MKYLLFPGISITNLLWQVCWWYIVNSNVIHCYFVTNLLANEATIHSISDYSDPEIPPKSFPEIVYRAACSVIAHWSLYSCSHCLGSNKLYLVLWIESSSASRHRIIFPTSPQKVYFEELLIMFNLCKKST